MTKKIKFIRLVQKVGLLLTAGLIISSPAVMALSDEYINLFDKGIYYFDPSGGELTCDSNFSGSNNVEVAFNYFLAKDLSAKQTAGIIGNLQQESGVDLDPNAKNGEAIGIAQWLGERDDNLIKFADANGKDYLTLEAQLEFIWFEITGEPPTPGVTGANRPLLDELEKTKTIAAATELFFDGFEGAEDASLPARIDNAEKAFKEYGSNKPGGGSDSCASLGDAGAFSAFPLITTKKDIEKGSRNDAGVLFVWSYAATSNAHHDYNAADIHVEPGTKVVAALPGEVVSVTEEHNTDADVGVGSRLSIRSQNGKYINYYAHLKFGSITVKEGDSIAAGKVIAEVGPDEQAMGTGPHLHIDLLPRPPYETRISCSSAACSGYPFIDVQPWLLKLYEGVVPD